MNNLKKVGLTALGTALVATSAQAADVSVSMGTSIGFVGQDNNNQGSGWTMTDSVTFTTSGELDNGMSISHTLELDGTAVDTHKIAITMDGMGTLTYVGDGTLDRLVHGMILLLLQTRKHMVQLLLELNLVQQIMIQIQTTHLYMTIQSWMVWHLKHHTFLLMEHHQ